jgi:hypothetical protein
LVESNYWESKLPVPPAVDGFDAFAANVEHCRRRGSYRNVWEQSLPSPIQGTWDTVLAIELIEHLPQNRVGDALDALEGATRHRIIVTTPNSEILRPGMDTPVGFNPFEAHLSYVSRDFLRGRGYRVRGAGFGRYNSQLAKGAKRLRVRNSLTSITWRFPAIAETIVAIKDVQ